MKVHINYQSWKFT